MNERLAFWLLLLKDQDFCVAFVKSGKILWTIPSQNSIKILPLFPLCTSLTPCSCITKNIIQSSFPWKPRPQHSQRVYLLSRIWWCAKSFSKVNNLCLVCFCFTLWNTNAQICLNFLCNSFLVFVSQRMMMKKFPTLYMTFTMLCCFLSNLIQPLLILGPRLLTNFSRCLVKHLVLMKWFKRWKAFCSIFMKKLENCLILM